MRHRRELLVLLGVLSLSGCGSGGSHRGAGRTTSASVGTAASSGPAANGEAAKPPARILDDAAAALRAARGYALSATVIEDRQMMRLKIRASSAMATDLSVSIGNSTAEVIGLHNQSYVRGNSAFWRTLAGPRAMGMADRWIREPPASAGAVTSSLGRLAPATLARCLAEHHGTLSVAGETTIGGRRAVLVRDAGDAPGSAPGVLAVAANGTPYPLRLITTGGQLAGGAIDVCNDGRASDEHGTITFSQFGHIPAVRPPAGAEEPSLGTSV